MNIHQGMIADSDLLTLAELSDMLSVSDKVIIEWIEHDVIYAVRKKNVYYVSCNQLTRAKAALRLARDLGINAPGIAVIYDLRQRVKELEALVSSITK